MKTHKLSVTITANCTAAEASTYAKIALSCWGGNCEPSSPFFGNNKKVVVKMCRQPPDIHNPENVPVRRLPPGRRFLTKGEQAKLGGDARPELWMWFGPGWDRDNHWNGSDSASTYCVPNDFTP